MNPDRARLHHVVAELQRLAAEKYADARLYRDAAGERTSVWDSDEIEVWACAAMRDAAALSRLARVAGGVEAP